VENEKQRDYRLSILSGDKFKSENRWKDPKKGGTTQKKEIESTGPYKRRGRKEGKRTRRTVSKFRK